jgi:tRNA-(ms[2]io[6]A)-hydroxylase
MLHLLVPSRPDWLPEALANLDLLLLDHAHCEMKAAANARHLAGRYPEVPAFVAAMHALAAEEDEHFRRVRALVAARGVAWRPAPKDGYVLHLLAAVRHPAPQHKLDKLIVASIIEARSCERLGMLAEALPEAAHRAFYRELFESEARHHGLFLEWARHFAGRAAADRRLEELLAHEAQYVRAKEPTAHVHG